MDDAKQLLLWWQSLVAGIGPAIHLWPEARCQLVPTEIPRRCMSLGGRMATSQCRCLH